MSGNMDEMMDETVSDSGLGRGRGRPRKDKARHKVCSVRFNEDETEMLEFFESRHGGNASEIVRRALRYYYYSITK